MKNEIKKGNVGVVVLVVILFIVVIAIALYVAYSTLYVKDNKDVLGGNVDNIDNVYNVDNVQNEQQEEENEENEINRFEEARELVEKYHYTAYGVKNYLTDMSKKELVAFTRTDISGTKSEADIKNTASYADETTQMKFAEFSNGSADYYSYKNVQKTLKELFGTNVELDKKTYINCSNSYYYVEEYNGFVKGNISCGGASFVEQLQVAGYAIGGETYYVYATIAKKYTDGNNSDMNTEKTYKYTFKLQNAEYYLDNVEEM